MANYLQRNAADKKKAFLAKREKELGHHIRNLSSTELLEKAAERVRLAQLGLIKALLDITEPRRPEDLTDKRAGIWEELLQKQKQWLDATVSQIIEKYPCSQ